VAEQKNYPFGAKPPLPRTLHDSNCVPAPEMPPPIRGDAPIAKGKIAGQSSVEQLIRGADLLPSRE